MSFVLLQIDSSKFACECLRLCDALSRLIPERWRIPPESLLMRFRRFRMPVNVNVPWKLWKSLALALKPAIGGR